MTTASARLRAGVRRFLHVASADLRVWCIAALPGVLSADPASAQRAPRASVVVIDSVNVIDVVGRRVDPLRRIVIRDDRIVAVQPVSAARPDSVTEWINAAGAYAIPGLTDHHVHLVPGSGPLLERAARGGVTMVNAMAGDARVHGEFARQVLMGELRGPEIAYASVMAGPDFFVDPRFIGSGVGYVAGTAPWVRAVTDTTDLVQAVAAARGSGAEVLKLYAMMDSSLAARLTAEAHRQRMRVVAHGTVFPARPLQLVQGGVDILTHVPYLAWQGAADITPRDAFRRAEGPFADVAVTSPAMSELVRAMRAHGTYLEPTLDVFASRTPDGLIAEWSRALTRAAFVAGVPILAGTDNLIGRDTAALPTIHRELEQLVSAGLAPADALASATLLPARAMGRERSHGRIAAGYVADIVLLRDNPLPDISTTARIRGVVLRGRVLR